MGTPLSTEALAAARRQAGSHPTCGHGAGLAGQTGLARAARPGERHQPSGGEQFPDGGGTCQSSAGSWRNMAGSSSRSAAAGSSPGFLAKVGPRLLVVRSASRLPAAPVGRACAVSGGREREAGPGSQAICKLFVTSRADNRDTNPAEPRPSGRRGQAGCHRGPRTEPPRKDTMVTHLARAAAPPERQGCWRVAEVAGCGRWRPGHHRAGHHQAGHHQAADARPGVPGKRHSGARRPSRCLRAGHPAGSPPVTSNGGFHLGATWKGST